MVYHRNNPALSCVTKRSDGPIFLLDSPFNICGAIHEATYDAFYMRI